LCFYIHLKVNAHAVNITTSNGHLLACANHFIIYEFIFVSSRIFQWLLDCPKRSFYRVACVFLDKKSPNSFSDVIIQQNGPALIDWSKRPTEFLPLVSYIHTCIYWYLSEFVMHTMHSQAPLESANNICFIITVLYYLAL